MAGKYKAIDLFAGIGGIRAGFEQAFNDEIETVFVSEWDKFAQQTYIANYGNDPEIRGDITQIKSSEIPACNIVLAGFPCQPFSLAGVSKKQSLGRAHGFADETQGTLFFEVARIIADKQPEAFMLENVKNLLSHDKGNTFKTIYSVLTEDLRYHVHYKVLDAIHWSCQHRERIYIVGFKEDLDFSWDHLCVPKGEFALGDILEENPDEKYTISDKLWSYLRAYAEKHRAKGNGFGFGLVAPDKTTRTLSARYHKDGSEILVAQPGKNPRKLTPRECAKLQGFSESFIIPVSDTQAYRQFGNSVSVPVVHAVAELMQESLNNGLRGAE